jgi:penicillin-binding protein 1A
MAEPDATPPERRRRRVPRWLVSILGVLALLSGLAVAALVGGYRYFSRDLPSPEVLARYEPPLPTHVRAGDGTHLATFARERRIYTPYSALPPKLIQAFISAEDKTFFEHEGLDYPGIAQALWTNILEYGTGRRPVGASTITQQVAKNLVLGGEVSLARKIREAILARRIEQTFSKEEILEIYLNMIFLGRNAYGVEAAAQAYFDRPVGGLSLEQMAYLAVLPKAPANYNPDRFPQRAIERRNWVLAQMAANGYISPAERAAAAARPLGVVRQRAEERDLLASWFVEDVRRWLIEKFGEEPKDGPHSVYGGGLWVRTSFDPRIQAIADRALRDGLMRIEAGRRWRGPVNSIDPGEGWAERLRALDVGAGYDTWRAAVVLSKAGGVARIGLEDGSEARLPAWGAATPERQTGRAAFEFLKPGDVIIVTRAAGDDYALRQIPELSGAIVVQDPRTGRVLAMAGGWDGRNSQFNRASQALRQPGSTFKPFVFSTALDNGMTPASIIRDAPFCVYQSARLGRKCFRNSGGGYAGAQTIRWALEQSRNLMTVRAASQVGMDKVVKTAKDLGIGEYQPVLAISLGAGETTVLKLTNAFAMLIANGRRLEPTIVDMVQDRNGRVIWRADNRPCQGCDAPDWLGTPMPRPAPTSGQAMDPVTAYQITHMLEGVVERGTAKVLRGLDRPIMGKTGTTTGPKDVWFVGGTPDMVAGVYIGYDQPRNLGSWAQGGRVAAPIWGQVAREMLKDKPARPFTAPPGVRMVRVERRTGRKVFGGWPSDDGNSAIIWEAFRPDSEPTRVVRRSDPLFADARAAATRVARTDAEFLSAQGGIY